MLSLIPDKAIERMLADAVRRRRLQLNLSQQTLARNSGVSLGSLRRFEEEGLISLRSLIALSASLGMSDDFLLLFKEKAPQTMRELEPLPQRKRGRQ